MPNGLTSSVTVASSAGFAGFGGLLGAAGVLSFAGSGAAGAACGCSAAPAVPALSSLRQSLSTWAEALLLAAFGFLSALLFAGLPLALRSRSLAFFRSGLFFFAALLLRLLRLRLELLFFLPPSLPRRLSLRERLRLSSLLPLRSRFPRSLSFPFFFSFSFSFRRRSLLGLLLELESLSRFPMVTTAASGSAPARLPGAPPPRAANRPTEQGPRASPGGRGGEPMEQTEPFIV
mmetsp:Transcript_79203/g.214474  ORF Transcript_79203/g.214474 Transcript_79203/m.214474 type:complete len:233 (-) Transcript_79203:51-749(-)